MLPEGNPERSQPPTALLLDASRPDSGRAVFGLPLLERCLRAALEAGLGGIRVWIQEGVGGTRVELPRELEARFDVVREELDAPLAKRVVERAQRVPALLVAEADAVIDPRVLAHLAGRRGGLVLFPPLPASATGRASAVLRLEGAPPEAPDAGDLVALARAWVTDGSLREEPAAAVPAHLTKLRRDLAPYAFRVESDADRDRAERFLFAANYKGSTDFFTKHVYPPLVWALLRPLARRRVHPNWISGLNVFITFAAVPFFAAGAWLPGLLLAYAMSVLDSVDGKLARLTYRASKLGHVLDHGLDVVHPPLWYLAWARGLGGGLLWTAAWWMLGLYVADRLVTEAFTQRTGGRSIHAWAPIDVRARTWISRRNINLPLFTVGLITGRAGLAFLVIVAWQAATLGFHGWRLVRVAGQLRRAGS